jgi:5-carboxymethyl-2-hydroxymuconate isomerase
MPHIIIEYSSKLVKDEQVMEMIDAVHEAVKSTDLFKIDHIKTRAIPVHFYRTGEHQGGFLHVQLRIKAGRTSLQKKLLSGSVLSAVKEQGWLVHVITVEVIDMDTDSYAKHSR